MLRTGVPARIIIHNKISHNDDYYRYSAPGKIVFMIRTKADSSRSPRFSRYIIACMYVEIYIYIKYSYNLSINTSIVVPIRRLHLSRAIASNLATRSKSIQSIVTNVLTVWYVVLIVAMVGGRE